MEASIQLIPKNTPQDCLRAQVFFFFHEEQWEEGGAESKRPSLHRGDLGRLECGGRFRIKSEGDLRSPVSSTREGPLLDVSAASRSSESTPGKPDSGRVPKLLSFTCGVLGILRSWRDKMGF